jgi:hypothetical protein
VHRASVVSWPPSRIPRTAPSGSRPTTFHQDIGEVLTDRLALVDGERSLCNGRNTAQGQLSEQSVLVDFLQESGSERAGDLEDRCQHTLRQRLEEFPFIGGHSVSHYRRSSAAEICNGRYYVAGSRDSLASIVYEYRDGAAAETIRQNSRRCPSSRSIGAIAFHLGHAEEVETYLASSKRSGMSWWEQPNPPVRSSSIGSRKQETFVGETSVKIRFQTDADLSTRSSREHCVAPRRWISIAPRPFRSRRYVRPPTTRSAEELVQQLAKRLGAGERIARQVP